jgi:LuxR family maltose regulon positive regulatory protein
MKTNVLLVDDHPVFRKGLRLLFEEDPDIRVVGEAGDGQAAVERIRELSPDVVIMDITMPGLNGIEATRQIIAESPDTKIIALSIHSGKGFVDDMLSAGAAGYVLKESAPEELVSSVRAVMKGEIYLSAAITEVVVTEYRERLSRDTVVEAVDKLTAPEKELIHLMAGGEKPEQIAVLLNLSKEAVDAVKRQVVEKLGVDNDKALLEKIKEKRFSDNRVSLLDPNGYAVIVNKMKLNRPRLPSGHVHRPALTERLDHHRNLPLTLVSAPAGYGKSILISCWLESSKETSAWFSVDEKDNDLRIFLSHFLAAVQTIFPDAGNETLEMIAAPELPPVEHLAGSLVNELEAIKKEFILVLDDIHLVREKTIFEIINELLRHPNPSMHMVLSGRRDPFLPISSLRAQDQVHEIRVGDLRFTAGQAQEYIEQELSRQIKPEAAETLTEKTEGWIAGLRLAALRIRHKGDIESLLPELTGGIQYVTEYLFNEVFENQGPEIRKYLLVSSVPEHFCASLCDALYGEDTDSAKNELDGRQFIDRLKKENIFIINLDTYNRWFRYHHLFRQLLQNQLKENCSDSVIAKLHICAGRWFAGHRMMEEAIRHFLAAGDTASAVEVVERNRQTILNNDKWYILKRLMSLLPDNIIRQRPELLLCRAWILYHQFRLVDIMPLMDIIEPLLGDDPEEQALYGEIDFFRGYCVYFLNDGPRSLNHLKAALEKIPVSHYEIRGQTELLFGLASQMEGQKEEAIQVLSDLLHEYQAPDNLRKTRLIVSLVYMHIISGDLTEALTANQQLMDVATGSDYLYAGAWSLYLHGLIHFQSNELDDAVYYFKRAKEKRFILHARAAIDCIAGLAFAYQFQQMIDKANNEMDILFEFVSQLKDPGWQLIADSCRARLSIMQGETKIDVRWLKNGSSADKEVMVWWNDIPAVTHCRTLIFKGTDAGLKAAEEKLDEYLKLNRAQHNIYQQIDILILLAVVHNKQKREDKAADFLKQAAVLAAPGKIVRPFIESISNLAGLFDELIRQNIETEFINDLLDDYNPGKPVIKTEALKEETSLLKISRASQPLVEPLTNREIDIMEMLDQRMQNKEIAEKLFISNETVKSHLKNIYQKMNVSSRREAVDAAKSLGIL